jgi:hypothetical protein
MSLVTAGAHPYAHAGMEMERRGLDGGWLDGGSHTLVVGGGLLGVGTSTVAALLALAVAAAGRRALLVECDGQAATLARWLGLRSAPPPAREPVQVRRGLALWRGGPGSEAHLPSGGPERYDLVVVDAGWRMESLVHACAGGAERALLVSTAGRASLSATFGLMKAVTYRFPGTRFDVVMNQQPEPTARQNREYLQTASLTFLGRSFVHAWTVPEDACLRAGIRGGMLLEDAAAESEVAHTVATMAARILTEEGGRRALLPDPLTLAGEL